MCLYNSVIKYSIMNIQSIVLLAIVIFLAVWVLYKVIKDKDKPSCGNCSCCHQSHCIKKPSEKE